jgi:hypothetical protein
MGQSKGSQFRKETVVTPEQQSYLNQLLQQAGPNTQQAAAGFQQFLPGGGGGEPIIKAAQQRYQQQTIPQILNAFGSGSKSSSALNQALAASGAQLNTDLAAQLAQLQLGAASGLAGIGQNQGALGAQTPQFALAPKPVPFWQQLLTGAIQQGGALGGAYLGAPKSTTNIGFPGIGGAGGGVPPIA